MGIVQEKQEKVGVVSVAGKGKTGGDLNLLMGEANAGFLFLQRATLLPVSSLELIDLE